MPAEPKAIHSTRWGGSRRLKGHPYNLMPRGSLKDPGISVCFPESVWAHGCIQLVMHELPLPLRFSTRFCSQFCSFANAANEKASKPANVIVTQNNLDIAAPEN
jgi:hypothetical protein